MVTTQPLQSRNSDHLSPPPNHSPRPSTKLGTAMVGATRDRWSRLAGRSSSASCLPLLGPAAAAGRADVYTVNSQHPRCGALVEAR